MPKIRQKAAQLVYRGWSTRKVARHFGFSQSVIVKWIKKATRIGYHPIPTRSSHPKSHPKQLPKEIVDQIIESRLRTKRTSESDIARRMFGQSGKECFLPELRPGKVFAILQLQTATLGNFSASPDAINHKVIPSYWLDYGWVYIALEDVSHHDHILKEKLKFTLRTRRPTRTPRRK